MRDFVTFIHNFLCLKVFWKNVCIKVEITRGPQRFSKKNIFQNYVPQTLVAWEPRSWQKILILMLKSF